MKILLSILLVAGMWGDGDINKVSKANQAKKSAEKAYLSKDYGQAVKQYNLLLDSLQVKDDRALLNRAHSYYHLKDTSNAVSQYSQLTIAPNKELKSIAYQQLGVINEQQGNLKGALSQFKNALKANPNNSEARYNYELLKKKIQQQEQNKDQNQDDKKDQEKKDEEGDKKEDKENKDGEQKEDQKDGEKKEQEGKNGEKKEEKDEQGKEGEKKEDKENKDGEKKEGKEGEEKSEEEKKEEKGEPLSPEEQKKKEEEAKKQAQMQRFQDIEMSEDKAKMILNAMKQSEKQYLQQLKKQPTQRQDSDKPDW